MKLSKFSIISSARFVWCANRRMGSSATERRRSAFQGFAASCATNAEGDKWSCLPQVLFPLQQMMIIRIPGYIILIIYHLYHILFCFYLFVDTYLYPSYYLLHILFVEYLHPILFCFILFWFILNLCYVMIKKIVK